jgi:hypothetical protein
MNKKILIIWQAPSLKKQDFPYDTTMLYDWFDEVWISKEKAVSICDFEAMTDKKPKIWKKMRTFSSLKKGNAKILWISIKN